MSEKFWFFPSIKSRYAPFDLRHAEKNINFTSENSYAGPGSQIISDAFTVGYEHYMTTNKRVIYAFIDARGTDNRGSVSLYQVYRDLGNFEIQDQIDVTMWEPFLYY